ncbi:VCBS domain-containing protein, partial [Denitromonas iodatirespirans]
DLGIAATGSLDIQITDSVPVAINDTNVIAEDAASTVSGSVLTNDTVGADTNATPITAATPTLTYGSLILNADGSYTYTLDNTNAAVNALNDGETLTDSYTYTLTDGDGTSTTATLTITINGHTDG